MQGIPRCLFRANVLSANQLATAQHNLRWLYQKAGLSRFGPAGCLTGCIMSLSQTGWVLLFSVGALSNRARIRQS